MAGVVEQQTVMPPASLPDRVWDLFTDNVLVVIGLGLAGVLIGIATVQGVKLGLRVVLGDPSDLPTKAARALLYRFCGMVLGTVYTAALIMTVTDYPMAVRLIVGSGAGIVAGGFTPRAYEFLQNTLWPWLSRKFTSGGPPEPPDYDEGDDKTTTKFKK